MATRHVWVVAVALGILASPAAAQELSFTRVARGPLTTGEGPVFSGDEVLVGSRRGRRAVVEVRGSDGSLHRVLRVRGAEASVVALAASDRAVAILTDTISFAAAAAGGNGTAFGPPGGPFAAFPFYPDDVGVAGSRVLAHDYRRGRVRVWDVDAPGAPARDIRVPRDVIFLGAAGRYFAFLDGSPGRQHVSVYDVDTGVQAYRVRSSGFREAALGPDGRLVLVERDARGLELVTATPGTPRRALARIKLADQHVAVSESGVAAVRRGPGRLAQVVVVGNDGVQRAVTPPLNGIDSLAYEGARLAFGAGRCVFAGTVPAEVAPAAPRDPCFTAFASLSFGRLDRIGQRDGARVRVPLTCTVPPRNHCVVHLRLSGPGFTVHRRTAIRPGRRIVRIRIPKAHRRAAWSRGMSLSTIEHGIETSGSTLPF